MGMLTRAALQARGRVCLEGHTATVTLLKHINIKLGLTFTKTSPGRRRELFSHDD